MTAEAVEEDELVFGTAADPVVLDGALVSDGESLRAIDQIFEGLVTLKPGTTESYPASRRAWEADDGRHGVDVQAPRGREVPRRHAFNAEAVCFNFDRWYNFKGPFQSASASTTGRRSSAASSRPDNDARRASTRAARRRTRTRS